MAREFSANFYHSPEWRQCRDAFIMSRNGLCERCLSQGRLVKGTQVHHKTYLTPSNINDPDITVNWDNLELLCDECHAKEHHAAKDIEHGLAFDKDGNLVKA